MKESKIIAMVFVFLCTIANISAVFAADANERHRVIVTTDGEIDDQCSLTRLLLYGNEFEIEAIVKTSSQYHSQTNGKWAGDDWNVPTFEAYGKSYTNLLKHASGYPTLEYLQSITKMGNASKEGEMTKETEGALFIADILLDETDNRPIWLQAWGGVNSIAAALKIIEDKHPDKMETVAKKCRLYLIWEQDNTFQSYIRNKWAKPYNITTIISDQFITFGYWWQRWNMPKELSTHLNQEWMIKNIFKTDNPMMAIYKANTESKNGKGKLQFMGEGDSPSFIHQIQTGLRSTESPDWGGWGGRFVLVRESTWLDKIPEGYSYPSGRWYTSTGWGRNHLNGKQAEKEEYFKPTTRWFDAVQNDFAARVDWLVKPYAEANHEPVVKLAHALDMKAKPGAKIELSAKGTTDPDGNTLTYKWWQYEEADTYDGKVTITNAGQQDASFVVPSDAQKGKTIHIVCEVTDNGTPPLTRYQRLVVEVDPNATTAIKNNVSPAGRVNVTTNFSNRMLSVGYTLNTPDKVTLKVYNLSGHEIATVVNKHQAAGSHKATWQIGDLPNGLYFYRLQAGALSETVKLTLQK